MSVKAICEILLNVIKILNEILYIPQSYLLKHEFWSVLLIKNIFPQFFDIFINKKNCAK